MMEHHNTLLYFVQIVFLLVSYGLFQGIYASGEEGANTDDDKYPLINVTQGQVQGLRRQTSKGKTFYSFKGIPYAEPPIGNLRFKDPVANKPWSGIHNASEDGNVCPQIGLFDGIVRGDEDCLFLNVYTPKLPKAGVEKYPVVVYIHGGGFSAGSASEIETPPEVFMDIDVILIAMNYRLDMFGFLSLDIAEVPGNAALKDQLLAMKWVDENIEYFNGNKYNKTLHGLSAGSTAVELQLLHTKSRGLFQRASMQSGTIIASWSRPRSQKKTIEKLVKLIGGNNEPNEILLELNQKTTMEILQISIGIKDNETLQSGLIFAPFTPVVERSFPNVEAFLTDDPLELYKMGKFTKVPILKSLCKDEGYTFRKLYGDFLISKMNNRQYADFIQFVSVLDKDNVNGNLSALYSAKNGSESSQVNEFLSDLMFVAGINQVLKYIVKDTTNEHYSYLFSFAGSIQITNYPPLVGSPHGSDMMYFMFFPERAMNVEEKKMHEYLKSIYQSFIKFGKPSAPNTVWDPITEESFNVLNIDGTNNKMETFPFADRTNYWDTLFI